MYENGLDSIFKLYDTILPVVRFGLLYRTGENRVSGDGFSWRDAMPVIICGHGSKSTSPLHSIDYEYKCMNTYFSNTSLPGK